MITRQIYNTGSPLVAPDGTPLFNISISFTLVDEYRAPIDVYDVTTREKIMGTTTVMTDGRGEFTINLWPNSRGEITSYYLVEVDYIGFRPFMSALIESATPISWFDFQFQGTQVTPAQYDIIANLINSIQERYGKDSYTVADLNTKSYVLSSPALLGSETVTLNGLELDDDEYTLGDTTLVIADSVELVAGDKLVVRYKIGS